MKTGILILLLAMSLLFNVFFAAGFLRARHEAKLAGSHADPAARQVVSELNLDAPQQAAFEQLRSSMREEQEVYAGSMSLLRAELLDELKRDQPDLEKVRSLVSREAELMRQRREAESGRFSTFVGMLNPDQCRRLSARIGGRGPWGRPPGESPHDGSGREAIMRQFDANQDGQLSPDEKMHAKDALDRMRHEFERRREEWQLERFDRDGDGKLSDDEKNAMRRWFFEQSRRWPRQPGGPDGPPPPPPERTENPEASGSPADDRFRPPPPRSNDGQEPPGSATSPDGNSAA
jgi:hypothetical protein